MLQCFSLYFLIPLLSLHLFSFILSFPITFAFHVHARWLVLILVPSTSSISLRVVAVRLITTVQALSPHYCDQRVSCKAINAVVTTFSLDILGLSFVLCFCNAYLCQQNFLKHPPRRQPIYSELSFDYPRMHLSSAHPIKPL